MKKAGNLLGVIVMIIAGIIMIISPGDTLTTAAKILGIALIVYGIIAAAAFFLQKDKEQRSVVKLIYGIVAAVVGIIVLASPQFLIDIFPIVVGVIIAVSGAANLVRTLRVKKNGGSGWQILLVLSLVTIALGILIFANPFGSMSTLIRVIGVILVYNGVVGLIAGIKS